MIRRRQSASILEAFATSAQCFSSAWLSASTKSPSESSSDAYGVLSQCTNDASLTI